MTVEIEDINLKNRWYFTKRLRPNCYHNVQSC